MSHLLRRVYEGVGKDRLLQFGIRSGTREEWAFAREEGTLFTDPHRLAEGATGRPIYITVDLDVLDPSVMPETGTPEPGGLSFLELREMLMLLKGEKIVGADVVEYCPAPGLGGPSGAVAAKVVRDLIFLINEGRQ